MPFKYGDVVVKVQKLRDGSVSRVNAIVLSSSTAPQVKHDRTVHEEAEHLDLAYPDPGLVPAGQVLKTRNVDSIFRLAYSVAPYSEDKAIGYEPAIHGEPIKAFLHLISQPAVQDFADSDEGSEQLTAIMAEYHAKKDAIPVEGAVGDGDSAFRIDSELAKAFVDAQLAEQAAREPVGTQANADLVPDRIEVDAEDGNPSAEDLDAVEAERAIAKATEGQEPSSSLEQ